MRKGLIASVAALVVVALGARGVGSRRIEQLRTSRRGHARLQDGRRRIASILSGPAAALGQDQLRWARVFLQFWNSGKAIPGVPKGFKRTKLRIRAVGDSGTQPADGRDDCRSDAVEQEGARHVGLRGLEREPRAAARCSTAAAWCTFGLGDRATDRRGEC